MSYCHTHGYYPDFADGCPSCQQIEDENQQLLEKIANWDFGDYFCPHCKFKTLRRNAEVCPLCKSKPGGRLWARIDSEERERRIAKEEATARAVERERRRKIQQAEDWEREAPARATAAQSQAAAARSQQAHIQTVSLVLIYVSYLGPLLFLGAPTYFTDIPRRWDNRTAILLFPVLNWTEVINGLLYPLRHSNHFWYPLIGFLACGGASYVLLVLLKEISSVRLKWLVYGAVIVFTLLLVIGRSFLPVWAAAR